jgi:hypothetical protein
MPSFSFASAALSSTLGGSVKLRRNRVVTALIQQEVSVLAVALTIFLAALRRRS